MSDLNAIFYATRNVLGPHGPANLYHRAKTLLRDTEDPVAIALAQDVLALIPNAYWPPEPERAEAAPCSGSGCDCPHDAGCARRVHDANECDCHKAGGAA